MRSIYINDQCLMDGKDGNGSGNDPKIVGSFCLLEVETEAPFQTASLKNDTSKIGI